MMIPMDMDPILAAQLGTIFVMSVMAAIGFYGLYERKKYGEHEPKSYDEKRRL